MSATSEPLNPQHQIGLTLNNKFKLLSILGEGSFAVVFFGEHLYNGNHVAIKCLYKTGLSDNQLLIQKEEVDILSKLTEHDFIISLLETIETEDHLYMVMEYCETDLFDGITNGGLLEYSETFRLFSELVEAVAICHENGIYHRDLKPENVLLNNKINPSIRLADFGLSTKDDLSTDFGCGSVSYMSPECHNANTTIPLPYLSSANDVWSLGIILINFLTGKNPWSKPSSTDKHFRSHMLTKHSVDSFRTQFNFSDSVCQILRMVFHLDPMRRPTARQFLHLFQQLTCFFYTDDSSSIQKVPKLVPYNNIPPVTAMLTPCSMPSDSPSSITEQTQNTKHSFALPPTPESYKDVFTVENMNSNLNTTSIEESDWGVKCDWGLMFDMEMND
jgi:serine/threonine protein kinase